MGLTGANNTLYLEHTKDTTQQRKNKMNIAQRQIKEIEEDIDWAQKVSKEMMKFGGCSLFPPMFTNSQKELEAFIEDRKEELEEVKEWGKKRHLIS